MTPRERLTRKETQARTRSQILDAAGKVFSERGMHGASVDRVVAEAGYTKGAFYANFQSKEDLFLALLDARFAEREAAFDAQLAHTDVGLAEQARAGGIDFTAYLARDPEWERLFFEFAAQAGRDDAFRTRLVGKYDELIDRLADSITRYVAAVGLPLPDDVRRFALLVFAAANGLALQRMLDPEHVDDELMGDMFELLVRGALAKLSTTS